MKKKEKSKHFVCFALKTSKTLKVTIQHQKSQRLQWNNKKMQHISYIKNRVKKKIETAMARLLHIFAEESSSKTV